MLKNKKIVVAMSGGVDSSVAAYLLKSKGYDVIGITMKTWGFNDFPEKDSGCCSLEAIYNARSVADQLGFPHYTVDFTEKFNETVINDFISEYIKGRTPNPCVLCNKVIKWGALLKKAENLDADLIATGHYAKITFDTHYRRYHISVSADRIKDQSYALWRLPQDALSRTIFPLGELTKNEVREIAARLGLKTSATPDSQELCFVPNDDYRKLLYYRIPELKEKTENGDIIYKNEVIGKHGGYTNYTIGQRRGLKVSVGKPLYVTGTDPKNNIVYVDEESALYKKSFICKEVNLQKIAELNSEMQVNVKIRYNDKSGSALIRPEGENVLVIFNEARKSITPGQSAVFYDGNDVIGGGIIEKIIN